MYIKRTPGPRTVTLPDGTVMTRADLPAPDTGRWVARRKAAVVRGVEAGLLTVEDACRTYGLSEEEFEGWRRRATLHGELALRATAIQRYRQL